MESGGSGEIEVPPVIPVREERVYVAVGKEVEENKETLLWALRNSGGKKVYILHVHQPAQLIPMTTGAKFPASKLKPGEVWAYRQHEREKMEKILDEYLLFCARQGVLAQKLVIEMDDIEKGILKLMVQHGITNLVMGAAAYPKLKKMAELRSEKAISDDREDNLSCSISIVCKGNLACTREASLYGNGLCVTPPSPISNPSTSAGLPIQSNMRSVSHGQVLNASSSLEETRAISMPWNLLSEGSGDQWEGITKGNISLGSMGSACSTSDEGVGTSASVSVERDGESEYGLVLLPVNELEQDGHFTSPVNEQEEEQVENHQLYKQLEKAMAEAEISRRQALEELVMRQKAEKDAFKAILKAKDYQSLYVKEMKQRKEIEELLAQELEKIKIQQEEVFKELQGAHEEKSALEIQVANSDDIAKESENQLSEAQQLLNTLLRERDDLQWERDEAVREAEELRQRNEEASTSSHRPPDLSEFSFLEIEAATSGFDPSLQIGGGGYGRVYKGILRHTPVAIKVLHPDGQQCWSEFQQEVDALSRVRHPNLVTLIGTCPEVSALVYEYLPNGSLEDRLACEDNTSPLSWQIRTRIASELCSALIFLHSNKTQVVVHGNLKPANILLDANLVSKLGDFGICHLMPQKNTETMLVYMDPEFNSTGVLTPSSDVYSFGITILRLLTGKPPLGIVEEVQQTLVEGTLHGILDELAGDWPFVQAQQLAYLGLSCCEMDPRSRPDLECEVWRVLEPMMALSRSPLSFQLLSKDPARIPSYFICPILLEIMQDPHVAADGFTYEAEAMRGWLEGHDTSPMTNVQLSQTNLIPNHALRSAIQEWLQRP